MSVFGLKKMLNQRNLLFLSVLLDIVTTPGPTHDYFWHRFCQYFPSQDGIPDEARNKLIEIKRMVDDYRSR